VLNGAPLFTDTDVLVEVNEVPKVELTPVTANLKNELNAGKSARVRVYVTVFDTAGFAID
jgi:hypothetical protein